MTMKERYENYAAERKKLADHPLLSKIHLNQEKRYVPPFNIYGQVWYVGDGDILTFGNITMEFFLCPGHTDGVISCFFTADGSEGTKRFGYYGGFGFNTLKKEYLEEIGDFECRTWDTYRNSLARVRDQKVDIMLGNHCNNNDTLGRRKRQIENPEGPNPFIDENWWREYLDQKAEELEAFTKKESSNISHIR